MHRGWLLFDLLIIGCESVCLALLADCSVSGTIADHSRFETSLTHLELKFPEGLKLYYGGALRIVPLKHLLSVEIDPTVSMVYDNELYYKTTVEFRDGTIIKSNSNKNSDDQDKIPFISIQNSLVGKNGKESYCISLERVSKVTQIK